MAYHIGLDLGGTDIKGGLLDGPRVLARQSIPTEAEQGPEHVMDRLGMLAREVAREAGVAWEAVAGVGVGTPGPTDGAGTVLQAPNLPGWTRIPLEAGLAERSGRRVVVVNDANAAAYGEYWAGTGRERGAAHVILLTLGTGVGGGVVMGGELFTGAHHAGAEVGHVILYPDGRPCGCGQHGCLEQYASATAIAADARRARDTAGTGVPSRLPSAPTCRDVFEAADDDDPLARRVVGDAAHHLGIACVVLTRIFDPQAIVLGGGVMAAGAPFLHRIREAFDRHTWSIRPDCVAIDPAALGNDAGFIGAAGLAARASRG